MLLLADADGGEKRTDTDTCSTQVINLINLKRGINLVGTGQNICNSIGCYGIKTASERVQLDQIQIISCLYKIGCCVQSGMIHPLIHNNQRTFYRIQMGDRIFRKNGKSVGGDHLRDTVVDLRIVMVWTTGKYNAAGSCLFYVSECFFTLFADVLTACSKFFPCSMSGIFDFFCWKILCRSKFTDQSVCDCLFACEGEEWIHEIYFTVYDWIHIVLDVLRV